MPEVNVTLLSQILKLIDRNAANKIICRHEADKHSKGNNTWTHLVSMLFCHFAKANSVREIADGLRSTTGNLVHLGAQNAPSKSSISYLNANRDWKVFRDLYFTLYDKLSPQMQRQRVFAKRLKRKIFLMDSTVIPLTLKLFDWAVFRQRKGAVKLHTILDYDTALPVFINMSDGKKHDVQVAKSVEFPSGSVVVMDRAYVDFNWLNDLDSKGVFFVTRLKSNVHYEVAERFLTDEKQECILEDADIELTGFYTKNKYPDKLRLVRVYDERNQKEIVILTNNLSWTAATISELYNARWDIETFFKAIKQTLRIKTFVGTSPNAVLIQVWTAMITILLLKYLQAKADYKWHLSNLVYVLRVNLFVKINLWKWINEPYVKANDPPGQFALFS